jgi:two-component system, cell cycle sensor histidine kinase and response regulator CckA
MSNIAPFAQPPADQPARATRQNLQLAGGIALLIAVTWADVGKPFGRNWSMCYLLCCFYAAWVLRGSRAWALFLVTSATVFLAPLYFAPDLLTSVSYINRLLGVLAGTIVFIQAFLRRRDATLLEASNKDLERRVSERTLELASTNSSLKSEIAERQQAEDHRRELQGPLLQSQKMEAIGKLAGGIAHDFNNILTVIIGYGETLLATWPQNSDNTRKSIQAIVDAGQRAASLTRQLLAFSRQSTLAPKILLLEEVVRDSEAMLRRLISENIELTVRFDSQNCKVRVDPNFLSQALINLVINARDSITGVGTISIETSAREVAASEIHHADAAPGLYGVISVADSGHGIPPEIQPRVFEPFFTTKANNKGTGIGLSVVDGTVRQIGGWVEVSSRPGEGATFRLSIPAVDAPLDPPLDPPAPNEEPQRPRGHEAILVVEDDRSVRELTSSILEHHGYRVLVAFDGNEALQVAANAPCKVDLLLTDVVMPHMGGRELAEKLRSRAPALKVLFMSGYTDDAIVRHHLENGDPPFQQKPFSPSALVEAVRIVLDKAL